MSRAKGKSVITLISALILIILYSCSSQNNQRTEKKIFKLTADRDTISSEMSRVLKTEFALWYPLSIDSSCGGFFSDIDYRWKVDGLQNKMIVTQARHVWSASNAFIFYQKDTIFRTVARYGVEFLKNKMWDPKFGGFYDLVDRRGDPVLENGQIVKRAYGNSFAIYGLAACYRAFGDTTALQLAKETFIWLDKHSYDKQYEGYFQFMSQEGNPMMNGYEGVPPKDYNSLIHLLECFTELYKVWPDPLVRERLNSLLLIIRDTVTSDRGYMLLYFDRDWKHRSFRDSSATVRENNYPYDHISFGHDVETAYLMLEASEALGMNNDTTTLRVGKKMVDHTLRNGWDNEHGGVYDAGYYMPGEQNVSIIKNTKEWWSQVEALNSLLIMSDIFPKDEMDYYRRFCIQWNYCRNYLIDDVHGGWYWGGTDIVPNLQYAPKGSIWKCNYHTSRSLINCINRIKNKRGID